MILNRLPNFLCYTVTLFGISRPQFRILLLSHFCQSLVFKDFRGLGTSQGANSDRTFPSFIGACTSRIDSNISWKVVAMPDGSSGRGLRMVLQSVVSYPEKEPCHISSCFEIGESFTFSLLYRKALIFLVPCSKKWSTIRISRISALRI